MKRLKSCLLHLLHSESPALVSLRRALGIATVAWVFVFTIAFGLDLPIADGSRGTRLPIDTPDASFWASMARWDSLWYFSIVEDGYSLSSGDPSNVAFFPAYPLLTSLLHHLLSLNPFIAAYIVSGLSTFTSIWLLHRWAWLKSDDLAVADRTILYYISYPCAFFLFAPYTESLFLATSIGAVFAAQRKSWLIAGLLGAVAAATRVTGIILWGVLGLMWLEQHGFYLLRILERQTWSNTVSAIKSDWNSALLLSIAPLGLLGFMLFLGYKFGDPLAFVHAQEAWGRQMSGPLGAVLGDVVHLWKVDIWSGLLLSHLQILNDLFFFFFAIITGIAVWRRYGAPDALWVLLGVIIPASAGTMSMFRFTLVLFPMFLLWAEIGVKSPWFDNFVRYAFPIGQAAALALYCNWYFVA